jgi:nicotinamide mononucleotide transporter
MAIYIMNGYYVMLILVIIQLVLSISGLVEWYQSYKEQGENKILG